MSRPMRVLSIIDRVGMDRGVVERALWAVRDQLELDVGRYWQADLCLVLDAPVAQARVELVASGPEPAPHGRVGSRAWVAVGQRRDLGAWTRWLSHQVVSLAVAPSLPEGLPATSRDVCGPVASMAYVIGGILVSGFVLPAWFQGTPGQTTFPDSRPG